MNVFEGGSGSSREDAIVVRCAGILEASTSLDEYVWQRHGKIDVDWRTVTSIVSQYEDKEYEMKIIRLRDGTQKTYWFDITDFFPKPPSPVKLTQLQLLLFVRELEDRF